MRRRIGLPAMEAACGFEEVDRLSVSVPCYADCDCRSNKDVGVVVVVLVREIISQELVRGPYI